MAEESLRENELGPEEGRAFARAFSQPAYEPDVAAYEVDPANDPYRRLTESVLAGATMTLSLPCMDGRREYIELDKMETQAWLRDPLRERVDFANQKICERRATVAVKAARRLSGKAVIEHRDLKPDEEAFMREFGLLEDARIPLAEGGYERKLRLHESNVSRALQRSGLREDGFWDGCFDDAAAYGYDAPTQREYLPRGGPMGQQQLISDVWDAQAKSYYAWTHDPAIRFACELISDFVLGRSFSVIANADAVQTVIDEFLNRELLPQAQQSVTPWGPGRITNRVHDMATTIWRDGELLLRKFRLGDGRMKVRSISTETIWEIITDSEDPLDVFYYVQRYQTRVVMFAPANLPQAQTHWVERWIARDDMLHVPINAKESDARGRSDVFPALGWAKRLRDYFDAVIQKSYAAAAYIMWLKVNGGSGNLQALAATAIPSGKPQPGSYLMTNDAVEAATIGSGVRASVSGEGSAYDALLNHIALSFGLNKSYFGVDSHANRATALVATEPTAKHLETRQDLVIAFLTKLLGDVVTEAMKYGKIPRNVDTGFKVKLPSIIKADAQTRGTMLRQGEGMGYWSKQTSAEEFAGEAEMPDYDFDEEQQRIKKETGEDGLRVIMKDMEQVEKGIPEPTEPAWPPGYVPNLAYQPNNGAPQNGKASTNGHSNGVTQPAPGPDPHDASPTSATGAAAVRNELGTGGQGDKRTMKQSEGWSDEDFHEECARRGVVTLKP